MPYSKEEKKEYNKKYREEHKEKSQEYDKKYREEHKEKISEYNKKYKEENKEKISEYNKKWREENKENRLEHAKAHRDKRRAHCIEYLGGKCVVCGTTHNLQFDHIKREGKKYTITEKITNYFTILKEELNKCQLLCVDCHKVKTKSERTK